MQWKIKNKPLFDINLITVIFENHLAPCRSFGNLRSKFALNPLAHKSLISGKCGNRWSKCPVATFSDCLPLQTYASYLCNQHGEKCVKSDKLYNIQIQKSSYEAQF